jgi:hypothetical protein
MNIIFKSANCSTLQSTRDHRYSWFIKRLERRILITANSFNNGLNNLQILIARISNNHSIHHFGMNEVNRIGNLHYMQISRMKLSPFSLLTRTWNSFFQVGPGPTRFLQPISYLWGSACHVVLARDWLGDSDWLCGVPTHVGTSGLPPPRLSLPVMGPAAAGPAGGRSRTAGGRSQNLIRAARLSLRLSPGHMHCGTRARAIWWCQVTLGETEVVPFSRDCMYRSVFKVCLFEWKMCLS